MRELGPSAFAKTDGKLRGEGGGGALLYTLELSSVEYVSTSIARISQCTYTHTDARRIRIYFRTLVWQGYARAYNRRQAQALPLAAGSYTRYVPKYTHSPLYVYSASKLTPFDAT